LSSFKGIKPSFFLALFDFPETPKLGESSLGDPGAFNGAFGGIIELNGLQGEPQVGLLVYTRCPGSIAKLVNITPISLWFMVLITMVYL
jgi:hypothetical protein